VTFRDLMKETQDVRIVGDSGTQAWFDRDRHRWMVAELMSSSTLEYGEPTPYEYEIEAVKALCELEGIG
jgi:hypothetical protein